jgi:membrane-associated phospholipid phosphatase
MIAIVTAATVTAQVPAREPSSAPPPQGPPDDSTPKSSTTPPPSINPEPSLEKRFIGNIFRDQRAILTSPFHLQGNDVKFLLPLGLATGGLIAADRRTANELIENGGSPDRVRISNEISRIGSFYGAGGITGAIYLFGRATHNARLRETGLLGAEALIDAGLDVNLIKSVTQRSRPPVDNGQGEFLEGGASFPSGHATTSWALAAVIAHEYKDNRLISLGAYGIATLVSVSRFTGRDHFLSDVLVGSAIGYGIGRYVYRQHHDPSLDPSGNDPQNNKAGGLIGSKLFPSIAPRYSRATSTYGLKLSWGL